MLITGGTGSFGKALVRELLQNHKLRKIIVFSRDELKQHEMRHEFEHKSLRFLLGDVRDRERLRIAMKSVDYVVHAAALKQVPAAEYDPMEFIKTNIHGAENVVQAAWAENVKKVVALSTDKAVNPINLYGATKLVSDKLFVAANNMVGAQGPIYAVVRYGNVIGSRGSVIPYFWQLIEEGEKSLPITHSAMTRFWITLEQGVNFVIDSFKRMQGGEIFIPKIPSMRIVDLATALAPELDHRIVGVRPGEKVHEALCSSDESNLLIEFDNYFLVQPSISYLDEELFAGKIDYTIDVDGTIGRQVPDGFEYSSGNNSKFLSRQELVDITGMIKDQI